MRELFLLNGELSESGVRGEIYLAGGAAMCLLFWAREATKDIYALLLPPAELRRAALAIAAREGLPANWLNDSERRSERRSEGVF